MVVQKMNFHERYAHNSRVHGGKVREPLM